MTIPQDEIRQQLVREFPMDPEGFHGYKHWQRVEAFGLYVARRSGADLEVVSWFAWFHDCLRYCDTRDPEHGLRGAARARELLAGVLDEGRLNLLCLACEDHDRGYTSQDPTVGTCWDADRLDLDRCLIRARADYMSTQCGKELTQLEYKERLALLST